MSDERVYFDVGADGYPPEWHAEIKHLVRERAGHRCERCHHPYLVGTHGNGEWSLCDEQCRHGYANTAEDGLGGRLARWRILTVHHLDGDKANCRWWNLAALCQRCHLTIQGRVKLEREFIAEHSEWFKPFAAGWYAWKYEGRDIDRGEALARIDELLAYEQRMERLPIEGAA